MLFSQVASADQKREIQMNFQIVTVTDSVIILSMIAMQIGAPSHSDTPVTPGAREAFVEFKFVLLYYYMYLGNPTF